MCIKLSENIRWHETIILLLRKLKGRRCLFDGLVSVDLSRRKNPYYQEGVRGGKDLGGIITYTLAPHSFPGNMEYLSLPYSPFLSLSGSTALGNSSTARSRYFRPSRW